MMHLCAEDHYSKLSSTVSPITYNLTLKFDFESTKFDGNIEINIHVEQKVYYIKMHALKLDINNVTIERISNFDQDNDQKIIETELIELNEKYETLTISFEEPLIFGEYLLKIDYEGELEEEIPKGLFFTNYVEKNIEKTLIISHFEPGFARKCFPCWDEPSRKAKFKINLIIPEEYTGLSNMPIESIEDINGMKKFSFMLSRIMSTYLVGIAIGDFNYIEKKLATGITVRVYALKKKQELGRFALEMAVKAIKFYTNYYKIPCCLPKLDLIAVPAYTFPNASQNWGLYIFRDINILFNPETSTNLTKRWISSVISHEVGHQWIGNLVTLKNWPEIWLQESLTHFSENLCVDYYFPEFKIWQHFISQTLSVSLVLDGDVTTHPIEIKAKKINDIDDYFDGISYNKGSSIIRMLNYYIGDDNYKNGMRLYLYKFRYANASVNDFYKILEETSKKPVTSFMNSWIKKEGFPVLDVSLSVGCDCKVPRENGVTLKFVQSKFDYANSNEKDVENVLWKIPISLITSKNQKDELNFIMDTQEVKVFIPGINVNDDWILVNPNRIGYYRVRYSTELLRKLYKPIKNQSISVINRTIILSDIFQMVQRNYTSMGEMMKLLLTYQDENEFIVWSAIRRNLNKLSILITGTSYEDGFDLFKQKLTSKIATALGWQKESDEQKFDRLLKNMKLGETFYFHDKKMLDEASKIFEDKSKLPDNLKLSCYRSIMRCKGEKYVDELIKLYRHIDSIEERKIITTALGSIEDDKLQRKVLSFAMSDDVFPCDTIMIVLAFSHNKTVSDLLWEYYRNHWRDIVVNNKTDQLNKKIIDIKEKFKNEPVTMELETYFNKQLPCNAESFKKILQQLRKKAEWLEKDSEEATKFLTFC